MKLYSETVYRRAMGLEFAYDKALKRRQYKTANRMKQELDGLWDQFEKHSREEFKCQK